ncbi:Rv3235 family protein [Catenuloplanes sp. NPDC051500]|uniref:Rv3235 family protein n=1 Tax=Catenuloplanes sp. NPDC051500 TaxID=3363959 RepID=UPI0037B7CF9C
MVMRLCDPRGVRPAIRVSRVPAFDPPFDDEPFAWSDADQLTLPWRAPPAISTSHAVSSAGTAGVSADVPAGVSAGPSPGATLPASSDTWPTTSLSGLATLAGLAGPGRTPPPIPPEALAGASSEARGAAHRFLTRSLEILNGYRPIGHLRAMSALMEAPTILTSAGAALSTIGRYREAAGLPPVAGRRPLPPAGRVNPRRLRVCEPRPGVAEASAVLTTAGRTWALAYRLELLHGRWLATAFTAV